MEPLKTVTDVSFIVVMDKPGAKTGRMPRGFYRKVDKLEVTRVQKSVYLVTDVTVLKELTNLGKAYGFMVQAFEGKELSDAEIQRLVEILEGS